MPSHPESDELETSPRATSTASSLRSTSTPALIRSYLVYTACSFPLIIDSAPGLLHAFTHSGIPGLKGLTEFVVRHTFFAQFVPGETVEECIPQMEAMRRRNVGAMLNYSAEADLDAAGEGDSREAGKAFEKKRLEEVYRALERAGEFEAGMEKRGGMRGSTCFALKITGLIDPDILARASTTLLRLRPLSQSSSPSSPLSGPHPPVAYPGTPLSSDAQVIARETGDTRYLLSLKGGVEGMGILESDEGLQDGDLEELGVLWGKLRDLGAFAKKKGVKLMIDAEHTWYQPALDAYTILLAQEYNRPPKRGLLGLGETESPIDGPLVFGTFQSYLNRQPEYLQAALHHAEENGYILGVKLVRGAYFVQERKKWKDEGRPGPDPIWADKEATDKAYDGSVTTIISTLARQLHSTHSERALNVVFGTHNQESCDLIVERLKAEGLAVLGEKKGSVRLREDVQGKVFVAQLYVGMKDDLTDRMAAAFEYAPIPFALKYIAYGQLAEVMPFLGRRAIENKAVMSGEGGAAAERSRLSGELWRRVFGG
ncbi:FAD-linked oxidoreductase-like protein [Dioszegia hungarica]|uniref:Proline dehydrogenase n=1 Tax=Dioszegia hungarica TaxID=4972 RepID=A0AA38HBD7_9TREE|nr:FAD-linked oxidoreductase-like protein [Dioszegia hungarica]KAI9637293.1 FAD-linked oxidoreductase-like protein [Dioszegia hungarica]